MGEELYQRLYYLVLVALESSDGDENEIVRDLIESAIKYTQIRASWNLMSLADKVADDSHRTACHNHLIDAFNIFLRYEKSIGRDDIDMTGYDRKTVGDVGNRIVYDLAVRMR